MYIEFYNLKEKPFNLTPSSKYLYLGDIHKEALALLTYGVIERMGFILMTGEVGTGKTTMIHALLNNLEEDVQCVHISNPLLSVSDFFDYLAYSTFKKKLHFQSKTEFLIRFEYFLKEKLRDQKNFILIIDEAQKLSVELLEEIRLLSNLETSDQKLINIFLVGQPELNEILSRVECRPLLQRISVRYHIRPLDQKATMDYVSTRLELAGAEKPFQIIPKNTVREIYKYSQGYPRMINILADNILLLGYSRGMKKLTPEMVKECYDDLQLSNSFFDRKENEETAPVASDKPLENKRNGKIRTAAVILVLLICAFLFGAYGKSIYQWLPFPSNSRDVPIEADKVNEASTPEKQDNNDAPDANEQNPVFQEKVQQDIEEEPAPDNIPVKEINLDSEAEADNGNRQVDQDDSSALLLQDMDPALNGSMLTKEPAEKAITIQEGETISGLAIAEYGYVNDRILDLIEEKNPQIENLDIVKAGSVIKFPSLENPAPDQNFTVHIASFIPFESARDLFNDLTGEGYEAYIIPVYDVNNKKFFRVTLGSFNNEEDAREYADELLEDGVTDYANVLKLEMR